MSTKNRVILALTGFGLILMGLALFLLTFSPETIYRIIGLAGGANSLFCGLLAIYSALRNSVAPCMKEVNHAENTTRIVPASIGHTPSAPGQ